MQYIALILLLLFYASPAQYNAKTRGRESWTLHCRMCVWGCKGSWRWKKPPKHANKINSSEANTKCSCKQAETRREDGHHSLERYHKFCLYLKSIHRVATTSYRSHILTILSRLTIEWFIWPMMLGRVRRAWKHVTWPRKIIQWNSRLSI